MLVTDRGRGIGAATAKLPASRGIETQVDVYSLKAVLYDLLAGELPSICAGCLSRKFCEAISMQSP
jgi:hypothetical protein